MTHSALDLFPDAVLMKSNFFFFFFLKKTKHYHVQNEIDAPHYVFMTGL